MKKNTLVKTLKQQIEEEADMNSEEEKVKEDKEKMRRWFNEKYDIEEDDIQRESPRPLS